MEQPRGSHHIRANSKRPNSSHVNQMSSHVFKCDQMCSHVCTCESHGPWQSCAVGSVSTMCIIVL